jgi:hypothetical protein
MLDHVRPSNSRLLQVTSGWLRVVRLGLDRLGEVSYVRLGQVDRLYHVVTLCHYVMLFQVNLC